MSSDKLLPDDIRAQAHEIMHRVNSDDDIPGMVLTYDEELVIKIFVDEDAYAASQSGQYEHVFPKQIGPYRVQYVNLHVTGRPIPFSNDEQAQDLLDLLMPAKGSYGVLLGELIGVDGGWRIHIVVRRDCNREAIIRIIDEHAPCYDVQITEISNRSIRR